MSRRDLISTTSNISSLCCSGLVLAARHLFDEMPDKDVVAWNAMLAGYSRSGHARHAISLFSAMMSHGTRPDPFSLTAVLSASADARDACWGTTLHALALRLGLASSLPVGNALIDMYGKCSTSPSDAARVFEGMVERNEVSWCSLLHGYVSSGQLANAHALFHRMPARNGVAYNILVTGFTELGEAERSVGLFRDMLCLDIDTDLSTFTCLMNACSELPHPGFGLTIHASIIRRGWDEAVEVCNSLISFYAKMDCLDDASRIFKCMETRSVVSWNAMIDARMRVGHVDTALSLFQGAPETNIVSWTTVIGGLARNGHGEQAVALFVDMMRKLLHPDDFVFASVLHAAALSTALEVGRMIHGCVTHAGFNSYLYVASALVNMYAKCGDIRCSGQVFDAISKKDLVSWNAMLMGYALHGWASRAVELYEDMLAHGVSPDKLTYISLLVACSHSGLIGKSRAFFEEMDAVHGVRPDKDHVTCIVDLLGRAGHLGEASRLLNVHSEMLCRTTTNSNEALLSACAVRGDTRIGLKVGVDLVSVEPWKDVGYVMLSNMYCSNGRWKEAEEVRRAMVQQGVKKAPGCSWIEVRDRLMVFVSGNQSLDQMSDTIMMLGWLEYEIKNPSFISFEKKS